MDRPKFPHHLDCKALTGITLDHLPQDGSLGRVRRYAKVSLEGWSFAPQELAGSPVEGEYILRLRLNTLDTAPQDFRQDKFLRILDSRK